MKTLKLLLLICASAISFSCSNQDEIVYSCDETINEWAVMNKKYIQSMNRTQWKELPSAKKVVAFRVFTPNQRQLFWIEKVKEVLSQNWTDEEKQHIQKLYDFISNNPNLFADGGMTDEMKNVYELFFYDWVEVGKTSLGWDLKTLWNIAANGDDINTTSKSTRKGVPFSKNNDVILKGSSCQCNVRYDFCPLTEGSSCVDADCVGADFGCGWLFLNDCNGQCE